MGNATGSKQGGLAFLSTHPSGPTRIRELEQSVPKVQGLYEAARGRGCRMGGGAAGCQVPPT
jgi:predicted Zn-dependent protease